MSGTGKSAALAELARRGHRVVDTDFGGYSEEVPSAEAGGWEQVWREDRIAALLDEHTDGALFVSGCVSNQGKFYPRFDAIVLLSAPRNVLLERVDSRDTNTFGKTDAERDRILRDLRTVEPLLRAGATAEIDTRAPLEQVVDELERIAGRTPTAAKTSNYSRTRIARAGTPSEPSSRRGRQTSRYSPGSTRRRSSPSSGTTPFPSSSRCASWSPIER
jgi:hypothetical protein